MKTGDLMTFGKRIQELREEMNITRKTLAEKMNISYSSMSKYETDERFPEKDMLVQFADFFDVSIDYIIGRSNTRKENDIKIALSSLSTDGLDDEDIKMVKDIINKLKKKNQKKY